MARPNKVKTSGYRKDIDKMIEDGVSDRAISKWLAKQEKNPEKISYQTINTYRNKHYNIDNTAKEFYADEQSQERLNKAGKEKAGKMSKLKEFVDMALGLGLTLPTHFKIDDATTELDVAKYIVQIVRLGIQGQKVISDFEKEDGPSDNEFIINIVGVGPDGEEDNLETEPETEEEHTD